MEKYPVPLVLLVFGAILVRTAWIGDDALITLRSVLNLLHGYGLTFNVIERVQTFTHPLWAMLLTAATFVIGNVYYATFALSFVASLAAFWLVLRGAASLPQAALASVMLLCSNAFVDYATSGLENPLAYILVAWLAATALRLGDDPRRGLTRLWIIASLLYLTRPDLVLIAAPSLVVWSWRGRRAGGRWGRAICVGLLPAAAWTLFALVYYGFPFPNTAYAKLGMGISRAELWHQGLLYFVDSLDRDPVTLVSIAVALAGGLAAGGVARHLTAGLALYLVYVASIGGDFMTGRFFAVPLYLAALVVSRARLDARPAYATAAALLAIGLTSARLPLASDSRVERTANMDTGIVDERSAYFRTHSAVWSTRHSFARPEWADPAPERLPRHVLNTCGLMGVAGLDWGPRTHLLDECALADPLLARMPAVFNVHWRIGHFRRFVPAGYRASLEQGRNLVEDPAVRALYADLEIITRSRRLLSTNRLAAIWRVNTGRAAAGINWLFYRHGGQIATLAELSEAKPDGTEWNASGVRVLTQPVAIVCEDKPGRRHLELSVDSNDRYHLLFVKRNRVVATTEVGPVPEYRRQPGLVTYTIDLPPSATRTGFDTVIVAPGAGDDSHSIGHLWLEGEPATDDALARRVAGRDRS